MVKMGKLCALKGPGVGPRNRPRVLVHSNWQEESLMDAIVGEAARFDWDGRHKPEPVSRVTLRPKGGMPLHVTML